MAASSPLPWPGFRRRRRCWWSLSAASPLLAAALAWTAGSASAEDIADGCSGGGEEAWTPQQRARCCESTGIGCTLEGRRQLRQHHRDEDGHVQHRQQQHQHQQQRQPPQPQQQQPERELHDNRCNGVCGLFGGRTTTCQDRIHHLSLHGYAERPDRCILAHGHVARWCPHCSGCSPAAAGCHEEQHVLPLPEQAPLRKAELLPAPTALPPMWEAPKVREAPAPLLAPAAGGCSAICGRVRGANASCGDRIREVALNSFAGEKHACARAYSFVAIRQCPHCSACELKAAGCQDEYEALEERTDALEARLAAQEASADGAPAASGEQAPPPRSHTGDHSAGAYDCKQGAEHWRRVWSDARQAYCCKHTGVGCTFADVSSAEEAAPRFDCDAEPASDWTEAKHIYCCRYKSKGCPLEQQLQQQQQQQQQQQSQYVAEFEAPPPLLPRPGHAGPPNLGLLLLTPLGVAAAACVLLAAGFAVRHGPHWLGRQFDSRVVSRERVPTCESDCELLDPLGGLE